MNKIKFNWLRPQNLPGWYEIKREEHMSDLRKAAEMALEALVNLKSNPNIEVWSVEADKTMEALRQALAQPEQEPEAWLVLSKDNSAVSLYAAPPKREWVGLTDKEIQEMNYSMRQRNMGVVKTEEIFREVEAKLKEKNGG